MRKVLKSFLLAVALLFCSVTHAQTNPGKIVYADDPGRIQIINADGTNVVTVTSNDVTPQSFNLDPSWSPDGSKFVFTSNRSGSGKAEIWMANADGSGLVRLTTSAQQNHFILPFEVAVFNTRFPFQQLIVRLPENLNTPILFVTVKINGSATNTAWISIKQ